jgi:glyoxylase-like metal-dependent hydrolase (beta-lactamase superfamily II)
MSAAGEANIAESFVSIRRLTHVDVAVNRTARLHWLPDFPAGQTWLTPDVVTDERGRAVVDVLGMVIRTPNAIVVVDPGAWQHDERGDVVDVVAGQPIDAALRHLHIETDEVTHVVVTHGHADHFSGLACDGPDGPRPMFANASHLVPAADWRSLTPAGRNQSLQACLEPVATSGLLTLVDGDCEVDPAVALLHAPGESDGHQVVRITDGGQVVYYLGDLFHFPGEFEHIDWAPSHADAALLASSRRRVLTDAQTAGSATLVFSHGRFPGWGSVAPNGGAWSWAYLQ